MWRLVLVLVLASLAADAQANHPLLVGWPPCKPGQIGMWEVYAHEDNRQRVVSVALTTVDFLDAATVICWLDPQQQVVAGAVLKQVKGTP